MIIVCFLTLQFGLREVARLLTPTFSGTSLKCRLGWQRTPRVAFGDVGNSTGRGTRPSFQNTLRSGVRFGHSTTHFLGEPLQHCWRPSVRVLDRR
jgi:hypothetical protein